MHEETVYRIALTQIPKIGAVHARRLEQHFGSSRAVFEASRTELLEVQRVGRVLCEYILQADLKEAEKEIQWMERHGVKPLYYADDVYPRRLGPYHDAPFMLYYKGEADLNSQRMVGVVGTRKPTVWGRNICENLVSGLQPYGGTLISGLAYGIDITAHRKAVSIEMPTIGIMANGLGTIYPAAHRKYAKEILSAGGGLLTEFTSNTRPDRERFPMRNRIIAGLSDALIVVETAIRGGSMITAHLANQYNKDVFAVPGRLQDEKSAGCHQLIKSHKAALIEHADDIGYVLRWEKWKEKKALQQALFIDLNEAEQELVNLLKNHAILRLDQLSELSQLSPNVLAGHLLALEFKGLIQMLPGAQYVLK